MAVFDVSYEISCWMKVRAKSAVEAEWIAERNPNAPYDSGAKGRKQGILFSESGEPHDFIVVEVRRRPGTWRGKARRRLSLAAASASAISEGKVRTGGDRHA
jgi:hypothetical protein